MQAREKAMYLGSEEIVHRVGEEGLLEGLSKEGIQGSGVDLRIDKLYTPTSEASIGDESVLPVMAEIEAKGGSFVLKPRGYYLCLTAERVNMPLDLVAFILPRSTLFRCGVSLKSAVVDPGYRGALTMGLKNETDFEFRLERGARIAQIVFSEVSGGVSGYEGRYQGGKVR